MASPSSQSIGQNSIARIVVQPSTQYLVIKIGVFKIKAMPNTFGLFIRSNALPNYAAKETLLFVVTLLYLKTIFYVVTCFG